jgi:hypothetical protein
MANCEFLCYYSLKVVFNIIFPIRSLNNFLRGFGAANQGSSSNLLSGFLSPNTLNIPSQGANSRNPGNFQIPSTNTNNDPLNTEGCRVPKLKFARIESNLPTINIDLIKPGILIVLGKCSKEYEGMQWAKFVTDTGEKLLNMNQHHEISINYLFCGRTFTNSGMMVTTSTNPNCDREVSTSTKFEPKIKWLRIESDQSPIDLDAKKVLWSNDFLILGKCAEKFPPMKWARLVTDKGTSHYLNLNNFNLISLRYHVSSPTTSANETNCVTESFCNHDLRALGIRIIEETVPNCNMRILPQYDPFNRGCKLQRVKWARIESNLSPISLDINYPIVVGRCSSDFPSMEHAKLVTNVGSKDLNLNLNHELRFNTESCEERPEKTGMRISSYEDPTCSRVKDFESTHKFQKLYFRHLLNGCNEPKITWARIESNLSPINLNVKNDLSIGKCTREFPSMQFAKLVTNIGSELLDLNSFYQIRFNGKPCPKPPYGVSDYSGQITVNIKNPDCNDLRLKYPISSFDDTAGCGSEYIKWARIESDLQPIALNVEETHYIGRCSQEFPLMKWARLVTNEGSQLLDISKTNFVHFNLKSCKNENLGVSVTSYQESDYDCKMVRDLISSSKAASRAVAWNLKN